MKCDGLMHCFSSLAADVEGVSSKLRETQDLLEAVEAEKLSAEAQVPSTYSTSVTFYIYSRILISQTEN